LEVFDAQLQPSRAVCDKVTAAPTLVKRRPAPLCDLSDSNRVRLGLDGPVRGTATNGGSLSAALTVRSRG
jgi:hypothetical protein